MTDTTLLDCALVKSGHTCKELAQYLGLSEMALYNKRNNNSEFKASEIKKICGFLDISPNERDAIFFA